MLTLPYNSLKLLGWTTVILVILTISFYILILLNKRIIRRPSNSVLNRFVKKILKKIIPFIRLYHPVFATAALITGLTHGYSLLQSVELHSGYVLWTSILLSATSGIILKLSRKKSYYLSIRKTHRMIMFLTFILMLYHLASMNNFI